MFSKCMLIGGSLFAIGTAAALAQTSVTISGMEINQAVQHLQSQQHLNTPADYGPDNSIPLVEGKAALVRVYVRRGGTDPNRVVGRLLVERRTASGWETVTTLASNGPATLDAQPTYKDVRGTLNRTLSFTIPAAEVRGALRLTATVLADGQTTTIAERQLETSVPVRRTLRLALITVGYDGPRPGTSDRIEAPPPTLDEGRTTAAATLAAFPVGADANVRIAGSFTQTEPLLTGIRAPMLGCPATWNRLMARVRQIRRADGPQPGWLYYGLLSPSIPYTSNTIGCGGGGVGTGKVGAVWTMGHELGHAAGLPHIPGRSSGCTGANASAAYPRYLPYRRGSIGEYGFDNRDGTLQLPAASFDMMQYCSPMWISPYHYRQLLNAPEFGEQQPLASYGFQPLVVLTGFLDAGGAVGDIEVMRLSARNETLGWQVRGVTAELLDARGTVLTSGPLHAVPTTGDGAVALQRSGRCPCLFEALLPDERRATAVRIRRGARILWRVNSPPSALAPGQLEAQQAGASVRLNWTGLQPAREVWIRYSRDDGRTWMMLDLGRYDGAYSVPGDRIAGGDGQVLFELLAADGLSTERLVSQAVRLR